MATPETAPLDLLRAENGQLVSCPPPPHTPMPPLQTGEPPNLHKPPKALQGGRPPLFTLSNILLGIG